MVRAKYRTQLETLQDQRDDLTLAIRQIEDDLNDANNIVVVVEPDRAPPIPPTPTPRRSTRSTTRTEQPVGGDPAALKADAVLDDQRDFPQQDDDGEEEEKFYTAEQKVIIINKLQTTLRRRSTDLLRIETALNKLGRDITADADSETAIKDEEYQKARESVHFAKQQILDLTKERNANDAIVALGDQLVTVISTINALVQKQLIPHHHLTDVLNQLADVDSFPVPIVAPFTNHSVSGMYALLVRHYSSPTIIEFFKELKKVLSTKFSTNAIDGAISRHDAMIAHWSKSQYWTYMNQDLFFSMLYLHRMPDDARSNDLKEAAIEHLLDYIRENPNAVHTSATGQVSAPDNNGSVTQNLPAGTSGLLPMYKRMKEFLRRKETSQSINAPTHGSDTMLSKPSGDKPYYQNRSRSTGQQQAMNAEADNTQHLDVAHSAHSPQQPGRRPTSHQPQAPVELAVQPRFDREMRRSKYHLRISGNLVPYVAALEICPKCTTDKPHNPKCVTSRCPVCDLFGHTKATCCQLAPSGHRVQVFERESSKKNTA